MLQYAQHPTQFFGSTQCTDDMVDGMEIEEEEECNVPTLKVNLHKNQFDCA
jgi:hypothetical protein